MSKVKIEGHGTGTGTFTVTTPSSNTDRTITLPDETATLSTFNPDGAVTINESGADVDFRVESDTNTHALFVQGSDGNVGIGTTAPILGKVHLLAAGTSDASLENVAHFGKNSTSRAGLQILANATQVDVGMQAQAGAGNLDLSFSSLVSGTRNERMRILSAGGLTFNGDTAADNALNDYETGTWTPVMNGTSGGATQAVYVKVGRMVTCHMMNWGFTATAVSATVTGLPFTSNGAYITGVVSACDWVTNAASVWGYSNSSLYVRDCVNRNEGTGRAGNPRYFSMSITYRTT